MKRTTKKKLDKQYNILNESVYLSTEDYIGFNEVEVTSEHHLNYLLHLSVIVYYVYICVGSDFSLKHY